MIARLRGTVVAKSPASITLEVGGVGYEVHVPLSTYYQLPSGEVPVSLLIRTYVREDTLALYGFLTAEEKVLFEMLIGISGIGPKLAIGVLSGLSVSELIPAILRGDVGRLSSVPGIGKKTAERLVVELKDKVRKLSSEEKLAAVMTPLGYDRNLEEAISALINLGYKETLAQKAVLAARQQLGLEADLEKLVRETLRVLRG
jgi:Holliday junction DNA helicase RuvA